ncbi:MAG: autotransporter outer membrane beta-barrel domain-containing protein [Devosia sp.]|nr:autotransporter outer membrane beta-barrel domain-containing protein [Devosia sp.]
MSHFRALRISAKYNILTPAALLGAGLSMALGLPARAVDYTNPAGTTVTSFTLHAGDSLTNNGTVSNSGAAVTSDGNPSFIINSSGALIESTGGNAIDLGSGIGTFTNGGEVTGADYGILITGDVTTSFTNSGQIYGNADRAVEIDGGVALFDNAATGIIGSQDSEAVYFDGLVSSFSNEGRITTSNVDDLGAVEFDSGVTSFSNSSTGLIQNQGFGDAVDIYGGDAITPAVGTFTNAGKIWSGKGAAVYIQSSDGLAAGSIVNSGNVWGSTTGFDIYGDVGDFTNQAGGVILAHNTDFYYSSGTASGVYISGNLTGTFSNSGSISAIGNFISKGYSGVYVTTGVAITGDVATFTNTATGQISASDGTFSYDGESYSLGGIGVAIEGATTDFSNAGSITGSDIGVYFGNFDGESYFGSSSAHVSNFTNSSTGVIEGDGVAGVYFSDGVDNFTNAGQIIGPVTSSFFSGGSSGVVIYGDVTSFSNSGSISGYEDGVYIDGSFSTFDNSGTITGTDAPGVYVAFDSAGFDTTSFSNSGTIQGRYDGVYLDNTGTLVSVTNSGTIAAVDVTPTDASVGLEFYGGSLNNSGTITGDVGVYIHGDAGDSTVVNTGSIIGTNGPGLEFDVADPTVTTSGLISGSTVSIQFAGTSPDTLILKTGAKFIGAVAFGPGTNTLDFSDYHGNMLFDYSGSADPTVVAGDKLFVDTGSGQIAIVDDTAIRDAAQPVEDLVGGIQGSIGDALNGHGTPAGNGDDFVAGYAPAAPSSPAARAAMSEGAKPGANGMTIWGDVYGGGDTNSSGAGTNTQFGGIVAGAQGEWVPGFTLGFLGSYGRTNFNVVDGPQTVTADTGVVGVYGKTRIDTIGLDFSVLAGFGSNSSTRTVTTITGDETATASFMSWFIAPEIGATLPVLTMQNGQLNVAGKLGYIGGNFAGYTETGSDANLTVGSEDIGVFDAKVELNGNTTLSGTGMGDAVLSGKVGLFAQTDVGGSAVPVSVLGLPTAGSSASGASGYGVYAGAGIDMPIQDGLTLGASVLGSARNDGNYGGIGKLKLSGSY